MILGLYSFQTFIYFLLLILSVLTLHTHLALIAWMFWTIIPETVLMLHMFINGMFREGVLSYLLGLRMSQCG